MNKVFGILLVGFALTIGSSVNAGNWNKSQKHGVQKGYRFKDTDWSHTFYANAGFPSNSEDRWNARWLAEGKTKFLRFRLFNGQIGTSSSDNKNRSGAAYWERAEVKAGPAKNQIFYFNKKKAYEIDFRVRFVEGFLDDRETFFQIHNYMKGCKQSSTPPIMLKFSSGIFRQDSATGWHNHSRAYPKNLGHITVKNLYKEWQTFRLIYGPSSQDGFAATKLFLNDVLIADEEKVWQAKCGKPHIKFGIYRPGDKNIPIKTSIVDFDYIKIREIK